MSGATAVRDVVVPGWLAEVVVRPRRAPVPWPEMIRAAGLDRAPAAGRVNWLFTLRLMACMGVAGVVSEVLPLQRSYWVPLTVAIVLKPDYGPGAGAGPGGGAGSGPGGGAPPARSRMRRSTYRALADLRAEFQRTMSEPPSISRRATAWWPAVIALEQVMDAITATALDVSHGAEVPASGVRQLRDALRAVSEAAATGSALAAVPELPDDETLSPVSEAVRAMLGVLGTGERLTV